MDELADPRSTWLRIVQFPVTRVILLAAAMIVLMAVNENIMQKFAGNPVLAALLVVVVDLTGLATYYAFVRYVERRPVSELALPGMGRELGIGLLIGAGLYTLCVVILMILGIYRVDGLNPWFFLFPAVSMALSSGVFEELLLRGVLFRIVEESLGSWISLLISSFVFGFLHLLNPQGTVTGALFISIEAGILLGAAYMATRRLWMSMGFHFAWNYTQSGIFSGIVSGNEASPGLVKATIDGPTTLTGGSFGLESSLIAFMLCTTSGVVLLLLAVRRGNIVRPVWKRNDSASLTEPRPQ